MAFAAFVAISLATFPVSLEATLPATFFAITKNAFTVLNHFRIALHGLHVVIYTMTIFVSDPSYS